MALNLFDVIVGAFSIYKSIENRTENQRRAKQLQADTDQAVAKKRTELDRLRSAQRVAYARAGLKLDGTPTVVIDGTREQGQMDIDLIKNLGQRRVDAYKLAASQARNNSLRKGISLVSRFF